MHPDDRLSRPSSFPAGGPVAIRRRPAHRPAAHRCGPGWNTCPVDQWVWPAYVGIFGGVVVFAAVFVPALAVQMRRYGRLSLPRLLGTAALAVYGVALVAYTMLPMPSGDVAAWCAQYATDGAQLRPFQFVDDIRSGTAGLGLKATLTSTVVLQVV